MIRFSARESRKSCGDKRGEGRLTIGIDSFYMISRHDTHCARSIPHLLLFHGKGKQSHENGTRIHQSLQARSDVGGRIHKEPHSPDLRKERRFYFGQVGGLKTASKAAAQGFSIWGRRSSSPNTSNAAFSLKSKSSNPAVGCDRGCLPVSL